MCKYFCNCEDSVCFILNINIYIYIYLYVYIYNYIYIYIYIYMIIYILQTFYVAKEYAQY